MKSRSLIALLLLLCLIAIGFKACNYYFLKSSPVIESFEKLNVSLEGGMASLKPEINTLHLTIAEKLVGHEDSLVYTEMLKNLNAQSTGLVGQIDSLVNYLEVNGTNSRDKKIITKLLIDEKNGEQLKFGLSTFHQLIINEFLERRNPVLDKCEFELKEFFEAEIYEDPLVIEKTFDQSWEKKYFYKMPLTPGIVLLKKIKKDVLVAELTCLKIISACLKMDSRKSS